MVEYKPVALSIISHAQSRLSDVYNRRILIMRNGTVEHKWREQRERDDGYLIHVSLK